MQEEMEAVDTVVRAIDRITRRGRFAEFELSNGIVLSLKPVPPLLIQAVNQEFVSPEPPRVFLEDKGREEENPNDPEYLRELLAMEDARQLAITDLILGVGTSVKSVPEGYFKPEDEGWLKYVEYAKRISGKDIAIAPSDDDLKRYLHWLRFYALETGADLAVVSGLPLQLAGISEQEVAEVMESFRGVSQRGTDSEPPTPIGGEDGNRANRAARRASKRDGGA